MTLDLRDSAFKDEPSTSTTLYRVFYDHNTERKVLRLKTVYIGILSAYQYLGWLSSSDVLLVRNIGLL